MESPPLLRVIGPTPVDLPAGAFTLIAPANPRRVSLIVTPVGAIASYKLWFSPAVADIGITPYSGQLHTMIHRSLFPVLVGFDWFAYSAAPLTIYVVDTVEN